MPKKKVSKSLGLEDERFAHLRSDPKFSALSNREKKVTIEKRFAEALKDKKFSSRAQIDKRGRTFTRTSGIGILNLYEARESDDDGSNALSTRRSNGDHEGSRSNGHSLKCANDDSFDQDFSSSFSNIGKQDQKTLYTKSCENERLFKIDLARGEGNVSSSDDDSDWEFESNEIDQLEIDLASLDQDAVQVDNATSRIAACNMDWNLVKCEDLMVLAKSFIPPGGFIKRITIYLSDFGAERLAEEDQYGPKLQLKKPIEKYDGDEMDDETRLAMRRYQVDQLRYYYAIIECDSAETALSIYDQCDGYHFESSDLKMDLRFVPDGMEFDSEKIKEELSEEDVNVAKYKSKDKLKSAVTQTNARIAWDETEELRSRKFAEAFSNPDNCHTDLIANSESDDDFDNQRNRDALLSLLDSNEVRNELQICWDSDQLSNRKETEKHGSEDEIEDWRRYASAENIQRNEDGCDTGSTGSKIEPKKKKKNTYQLYLQKRKQEKAERKEKLRLLRESQCGLSRPSVVQPKTKHKKSHVAKSAKEVDKAMLVEAVANDERFKALFTDSAFAIDPSFSGYKGSMMIEKQVLAKRQAEGNSNGSQSRENGFLIKLKNKSLKCNGRN